MGGAASDPLHKDVYLPAVTVIPVLWLTAGLAARDVIWAVLHDYARLGGWLREKLHQVPTGQPSATLLGRAFGLLAHPTHSFGGLFLFGGVLGEIAALIALFGRYNPVLLWGHVHRDPRAAAAVRPDPFPRVRGCRRLEPAQARGRCPVDLPRAQ
jgi:hypothetical protein